MYWLRSAAGYASGILISFSIIRTAGIPGLAKISQNRQKGRMEMDTKLKFNEPWILQRADPYVYRHTDGWYYFTASIPAYDGICLRRAKSLAELPQAEEVEIWHKHEEGPMSIHIWAPELHFLDGKWYIYYAGGDKDDVWEIRPYVLECQRSDCGPMERAWKDEAGAGRRLFF